MRHYLDALPNGLKVISVPVPTSESVTVTVWVGVGSRNETDRISGISHFLEHMVFKGSKKRPSAFEIANAVDAIGGEFNASTSKEWTNFYIKARNVHLEKAFDVLSDMVLNPLIPSKDLEREKGVIIEEIGMYEDTPMWKVPDLFENIIFKGNSLGRDIIGTKKTVTSFERKDFVDYRNKFYGSNNLCLTVSGGVKRDEVKRLSEKYFGDLKRVESKVQEEFKPLKNTKKLIISQKQKEQAHFVLGFLAGKMDDKNRIKEKVLSTILGGGMSSRLFTEVREKRGLAYSVRSSTERFVDTGYLDIYAGVDPKRVKEAIKVTLDECYKIANGKGKVTKGELEKAKEYLKGHMALSLEDSKNINTFFGVRQALLGKVETLESVFKAIDETTPDDIVKVAGKVLRPEGVFLAIVGPYKNKKEFENLLK